MNGWGAWWYIIRGNRWEQLIYTANLFTRQPPWRWTYLRYCHCISARPATRSAPTEIPEVWPGIACMNISVTWESEDKHLESLKCVLCMKYVYNITYTNRRIEQGFGCVQETHGVCSSKGFFEFENCLLIETCFSVSKASVTFIAESTAHLHSSLMTSFEQLIFRTWFQVVPLRFQDDCALTTPIWNVTFWLNTMVDRFKFQTLPSSLLVWALSAVRALLADGVWHNDLSWSHSNWWF